MKILVTGGAGFIGSAMIRFLITEGHHEVLNIDSYTYAASRRALADFDSEPALRTERIDINDKRRLVAAIAKFSPESIIHFAAESHVDNSISGPDVFLKTNVVGTFNLLEASRQHYDCLKSPQREKFRFIHVSTDEVFGALGPIGEFTEDSQYQPNSPYSASKAASDHLARAWNRTYGLPTIITNCSNNYGPYQFQEKFIPTVIKSALMEKPIPIYGDGSQIRDWLFVEDHAEALSLVLKNGVPGERYNIGGECEKSNIDIAKTICSIMDVNRPRSHGSYADLITHVTDRKGHDTRYAVDITKIKKQLGWKPRSDFDECLQRTVSWFIDEFSQECV